MTMDAIRHRLDLAAPRSVAYAAVATAAGQQGWWCKDSDIGSRIGDECELRFNRDGHIVTMRFRIDSLEAMERVRWTCVANPHDMWIGSEVTWEVGGNGERSTIAFSHEGLAGDGAPPEMIVDTWKHFMGSLKSYVEHGVGQPW